MIEVECALWEWVDSVGSGEKEIGEGENWRKVEGM